MVDATADTKRAQVVVDLGRIADGDEAALRAVYDAPSVKLFGVCLRISGDRETAEDILQQVYIKIWDRAGRFDAKRSSPITWLCVIARNTSLDWGMVRSQRSDRGRSGLLSSRGAFSATRFNNPAAV